MNRNFIHCYPTDHVFGMVMRLAGRMKSLLGGARGAAGLLRRDAPRNDGEEVLVCV